MIKNLSKLHYVFVLAILAIALALRLYKINSPIADWHEFRQADTASVSRLYLAGGIDLLHPHYQDISNIQSGHDNPNGYRFVEFPIYNALHALLSKATGWPIELAGRSLSVALSLFGLAGLWYLSKMFWGDRVALLVLAFAAVNAYWVYYSRVILPEPLMIALAAWSLVLLVKYLKSGLLFFAVLGGVFFGLAILEKPFIAAWFPGVAIVVLIQRDFRKFLTLAIVTIAASVPLGLWRLWMTQFPEGIPVSAWLLNGDGIRFHPAFFRWLFYERLVKLILGGWGIAAFVVGIAKKFNKDDLVPLGMLAGSVVYLFVVATGNVRHDYYQILFFPPLAMFIGRGLDELISGKWTGRLAGIFLAAIIFIGSTAFGWYEVKGYYQINHPEIVAAGIEVDRIAPKSSKVIAPYNGDTAFLYYTNRQGWPLGYDIDKKIAQGATTYVSVNFDDEVNSLMKHYKVLEKTPRYVIIDLTQKL